MNRAKCIYLLFVLLLTDVFSDIERLQISIDEVSIDESSLFNVPFEVCSTCYDISFSIENRISTPLVVCYLKNEKEPILY